MFLVTLKAHGKDTQHIRKDLPKKKKEAKKEQDVGYTSRHITSSELTGTM